MILIYRIFTIFLYPFLLLFVYFRKFFKKEDPKRFKEKILVSHFNVTQKNQSKLVWFHASSLGEFKSIIPIINQLNIDNKNLKFLITTNTLSSGNLAKLELEKIENAEHRYFPFDVDFLMENFFKLWKPDRIFLVEKRNPLVLPPNYEKIPEPGSIQLKKESEEEKIKKILQAPKMENTLKKNSSSIEESILNKIRK